ncbi:hypothetical protein ONE63_008437 [Megalurothrips usitatus]|uniref:Uncharacterized protein n=1 Tax=Megalurothrips usitatus TaxID=439358 RepID=A0AAV7XT22_9NEOP|nr:hypothetical protein ONE63_008437 [Megalurothrips usitatus]
MAHRATARVQVPTKRRAESPPPLSPGSPSSDSLDLVVDARKEALSLTRASAVPHQNLNNNILKRSRHAPPPRRGLARGGLGLAKAAVVDADQEEAVALTKKQPFVVRRRLRTDDSDDRDVCFDLSVDANDHDDDDDDDDDGDLGGGDASAEDDIAASGSSGAENEDRDDEVKRKCRAPPSLSCGVFALLANEVRGCARRREGSRGQPGDGGVLGARWGIMPEHRAGSSHTPPRPAALGLCAQTAAPPAPALYTGVWAFSGVLCGTLPASSAPRVAHAAALLRAHSAQRTATAAMTPPISRGASRVLRPPRFYGAADLALMTTCPGGGKLFRMLADAADSEMSGGASASRPARPAPCPPYGLHCALEYFPFFISFENLFFEGWTKCRSALTSPSLPFPALSCSPPRRWAGYWARGVLYRGAGRAGQGR